MYNQTIYSGLVNIIPFWSNNLIQIFGLGNEYNIVFNMILSELLKITTNTFSDNIWFIITLVCIICMLGYKFGFTINFNLFDKNEIIIVGKEINNFKETKLDYCDKILALNYYLINVKNIKNITYINDVSLIINNISNFKLSDGIYLSIFRKKLGDECILTSYSILYYNNDIEKFIDTIVKNYKTITNSEITLIGDEQNKILNYPEPIHAINYYVSINLNFPKLKCMKMINILDNELNQINLLKSSNTTNTTNTIDNSNLLQSDKTTKLDYSYTLDNIINFDLGNKIYLNIYRENSQVFYNIKSNNINCKKWLDNLINTYNQNKNSKFKNKLVLTGKEEIMFSMKSYKNYYYSKQMWTLNWLLIDNLGYQHYECINVEEKIVQYKYILEPLELYKIQEDLFLTVNKKISNSNYNSNYKPTTDNNNYNNSMDVIYTLYSNSLNIKNILENYVKKFEEYKNKISKNKILYHFTYSGMKDNQLIFNSKILSETNSDNELFETFDKIYNEHVDKLIKDIDKLKDILYYKSHGLKRKLGFLFYGIPGCGKTSSVVAMALYDSRHIIEIPFSLIKTHEEFEKIMNLKSINDIEINNNNIILLFDELDIGMEKIGSRTDSNSKNNILTNQEITSVIDGVIDGVMNGYCYLNKDTTSHKINLGTLLSKLDGIGNYNGLIIIGTTNCIDKLDPALYRELRLTPIEFKQLRKYDCIKIIESYFGKYDDNLNNLIKDRIITPTKLISLCQTYDNIPIEQFFNEKLINFF
jgi:hypothetical protein